MLKLRPRGVYVYLFGFVLFAFMLVVTYGLIIKPKLVRADGSSYPTCSIAMYGSGTYRSFTMSVDWNGTAITWQGPVPGDPNWSDHNIPFPGNYVWSDYFSVGYHTVTGSYAFRKESTGNMVNEMSCSRGFTVVQPNRQATAWLDYHSCDANGLLHTYVNVVDPDGGTPGFYLSIQAVGDTGWDYGGTGWRGPWYPPRNGATYSISIWAVDAQTGGVVGPGVYYYSCPPPPPPSCSMSLSPTAVPPNTSSTLSWSTTNATSFSVDQGVGALSPVAGGSRTVNPGASTKTYTGTASGPGGSINCSTTLTVLLPPSCSLSVNPAFVAPNGSSTLSWSSSDATSFTVDQGVGALSPVAGGSRLVYPGASTKTYTGTASGPGGTVNCSTILNVGTVGCSLNSILAIEPGETYTPQVTISYSGAATNFSATTTVTVNGTTNVHTIPLGPVPANYSTTVSVIPAIVFPVVGNYPVVSTTSGTVNGAPYGPINCNTAVLVVPVVLKPYFKVFNGGITVGAGFNSGTTTCTSSGTGQVSGFAASSPSFHGASTQYDLKALAPVADTFYSSGGRQPATPNFKALTFANNAASGAYGGSFGGTSCITDYYTTTKKTVVGSYSSANGNINIANSVAAAVNDQIESIGSRTFVGGNLAAGKRLTIYITGNVYIRNDITLDTSYTTVSDIPFFALVVKGNIMIDPSVSTLDGLYIAQSNDAGTGGTVYTCATSETTIPASTALYGSCRTKLTFNGSVVAKSIKLLRTNGTLLSGPANETAASANIAEVFNGMPELFLANPAFKIDESSAELYDSITSLPPLL